LDSEIWDECEKLKTVFSNHLTLINEFESQSVHREVNVCMIYHAAFAEMHIGYANVKLM